MGQGSKIFDKARRGHKRVILKVCLRLLRDKAKLGLFVGLRRVLLVFFEKVPDGFLKELGNGNLSVNAQMFQVF